MINCRKLWLSNNADCKEMLKLSIKPFAPIITPIMIIYNKVSWQVKDAKGVFTRVKAKATKNMKTVNITIGLQLRHFLLLSLIKLNCKETIKTLNHWSLTNWTFICLQVTQKATTTAKIMIERWRRSKNEKQKKQITFHPFHIILVQWPWLKS